MSNAKALEAVEQAMAALEQLGGTLTDASQEREARYREAIAGLRAAYGHLDTAKRELVTPLHADPQHLATFQGYMPPPEPDLPDLDA